jgi:hypothetical protein
MLLKIKHRRSFSEGAASNSPDMRGILLTSPSLDRRAMDMRFSPRQPYQEKRAKWGETQGVPLFYWPIANRIIEIRLTFGALMRTLGVL